MDHEELAVQGTKGAEEMNFIASKRQAVGAHVIEHELQVMRQTRERRRENLMNALKVERAVRLLSKLTAVSIAACGLVMAGSPASGQGIPKYVVSSHSTLSRPNTGPLVNMGVNSRGDLFVNEGALGENFGANPNITYEYPADGSPRVALFTVPSGGAYGASGVTVDSHDNVYITNFFGPGGTNGMDSQIYEFPFTNGSYPSPYIYSQGNYPGSCNPAMPATDTTPAKPANTGVCAVGQYIGAAYYYWQPIGFAVDGLGNSYMFSNYDNTNGNARNGIFLCAVLCNEQQVGASAATLVKGLAHAITSIAADATGDVFWADGSTVSYMANAPGQLVAGTSTVTVLDSTYHNPVGVTFDKAGNLYVNDNTGIYETPFVPNADPSKPGSLDPSKKFMIIPLTGTAPAGTAVDTRGNVYYAPFAAGNSGPGDLEKGELFAATFPSAPIGTASAPVTLTIVFDSAVTLGSITALQGGIAATEFAVAPGTCTAGTAFAAGSTCTFTATFTPGSVGLRKGSVVITDSTGAATTTYLSGAGTGTAVTVDPGTPSTVGAGFQAPTGIGIDAAGDAFVADAAANAVYEIPVGGGDAISIGSGLSVPTGVASDPAGNIFIVNQGSGTVVEVPNIAGTLTTSAQTTVLTGLNAPTDIVIDGEGNLFISNTGSNEVRQFPSVSRYGTVSTSVSLGINLNGPTGVALDATGKVYVASTANNQVIQIGEGSQSVVGAGLSAPTGVAVDASGSVLIADQGTGRLLRVPNEVGAGVDPVTKAPTVTHTLNSDHQVLLDSPVLYPYSMRLNGAGDLFVSDNNSADAGVYLLDRTSGLIDFGNYNLHTSSGPATIVLSSTGTMPLTITDPLYTAVPTASGFTVSAGTAVTACKGTSLVEGANCTLSAVYSPIVLGAVNYPLNLNAPASNTANPTVLLSGTGVALDSATAVISVTDPTGPITYGIPFTVSLTVTPTGDTPTPTGKVVFAFDGQNQRPVTLDANGVGSITFTGVNAGAHSVQAHYEGDDNYASVETQLLPLTILQAGVVNTFTISGDSATPLSSTPVNGISLLSVLTPNVTGLFGGTVTFALADGTVLGTSGIGQDPKTKIYSASLSVKSLPLGFYSITATYSGNTNYSSVVSTAVEVVISNPTFTVVPATHTVTSTGADPGAIQLVVSSYSNFQGGIDFQCTGLPANAYCVFRPALATLLAQTGALVNTVPQIPVTLYFKVDQDPNVIAGSSPTSFGWLGAILASGLLLYARRKRSVRELLGTGLLILISFGGIVGLGGCGSSSSSTRYVTPAGNYSISVTAVGTPVPRNGSPVATSNVSTAFQVDLTVK